MRIFLVVLATHVFLGSLAAAEPASAAYPGWTHSGSMFVITTPEGADLPASAAVENFPLLVRLHKDFFDFTLANAKGDDLRFSTAKGEPLAYQIEEWDADKGVASVWIRLPKIQGNSRQEIKLHWGKSDARPESDGRAVFNETNGYLSVWHMTGPVTDEVGTLTSIDAGTSRCDGVIGQARHFAGKQGLFCGDKIPNYPTGASSHSSEAWFRAAKPNGTVLSWGNEHAQGKVVMQYQSPPHVRMDCYFSEANVEGKSAIPLSEWAHVAHTYEKGNSRVYVNGVLDGVSMAPAAPLAIRSPARLWIGGWYNNYNFVGDVDEVRISKVARSADWIKLQYENQKPMQTLVGPVVQEGNEFSLSAEKVEVDEGKSVTLIANAGGAQKLYWLVKRDNLDTVVAVDRFSLTLDAGRVVGDARLAIQVKAVFPDGVKTKDIAVTVRENIPEPAFTLKAPASWDGRKTIEIVPQISNREAMKAKGADKLNYIWTVSDIATIREVRADRLVLNRAQNSGPMTVKAAIDNGGKTTTQPVTIAVTEPTWDSWIYLIRKDEKPVTGQFYARNNVNVGSLPYRGTLEEKAEAVFLKLYADDKLTYTLRDEPDAKNDYSFIAPLKPGLIKYKVEFGTIIEGKEKLVHTVGNLVCGDAYIIQGQSNAVATDFGKDAPAFRSEWIRTFGSTSGNAKGFAGWGNAVHRNRDGEKLQIGYWGMELGRRLVENHKIPVCLINGAVGGTRIDQHQRNAADPEDMTTIYGRLLWRVRQAKLTHGIRGVLWHQGENDQGADGPTGGYGWERYRQYFIDLAAAWKEDYPNIQHYYVFQIWPKSCAMGINGSDNRLREVQRTLPTAFSNLHVMSTLGIEPPGGCHFPAAGYAEFARLICPLVERDNYAKKSTTSVTPPNLTRAYFASAKRDEIVLEFDQPVKWDNALAGQFSLDGKKGKVASGSVAGNGLTLKLTTDSAAKTITYLDSAAWSQKALLVGENSIAALSFCEVPILVRKP